MGCGETLFLGNGGYVTCSYIPCPRPDAASDILDDDCAQHIVQLDEAQFTIRHPLRERLDDELMHCALHDWLLHEGPPELPGRYLVAWTSDIGEATWTPLSEDVVD